MSPERSEGKSHRFHNFVKSARGHFHAKAVREFLDEAGDYLDDPLSFREDVLKMSRLAAVGATGALAALAIASRFGYEKWRRQQNKEDLLIGMLIGNRELLSRGVPGREMFLTSLDEILFGTLLDKGYKIRFIDAITKDEPPDIYQRRGGLGVYRFNGDHAITEKLEQIMGSTEDTEIKGRLINAITTIDEQTEEWKRQQG